MKRIFTFLLVIVAFNAFSQKGLLLQEDFSSEEMPPAGWSIDDHAVNWSANVTNNSGGDAPEARFSWSPDFNGDSRLISPVFDVSSYSTLRISFKHAVDHYSGAYSLGVATTSDGGSTWNDVWTGGGSNVVEAIDVEITTADVGSEIFQVAFYFSGNSYNINYWYVDDITLYAPENLDLLTTGLMVPDYMAEGDVTLEAKVANFGVTEITSFDAYWQVDGGTEHMQTISGVSLNTGDSYSFSFDDVYAATAGDHDLEVWIANVNGGGNDDDVSNDMMSKTIHVATQSVANLPLFEEFTSSTCGPCASFNSSVFTPFLEQNAGELAIIKYQMDWPGSGDPYYTEEGGVRRYYYGVSAVPQLFTGGYNTPTSSTGVNGAFDEQLAKPSFVSIEAEHIVDVENGLIDVTANVTPYFNGDGFTLHIAVVEKVTTENASSNGETEFHYVMMKMLPDAAGTPLTFTAGETQTIAFDDYDLNGTFIEEMNDLAVVVFIQHEVSKEIFQSANSMEPTLTFEVASSGTPIENALVDINGTTLITDANGLASIALAPGDYNYIVTKAGYEQVTGTYTFDGTATLPVELTVASTTYTAVFIAEDMEGGYVEGAEIIIAGEVITTDASGSATIALASGVYDYSASAYGYYDLSGTITVTSSDLTTTLGFDPILYMVMFNVENDLGDDLEGASISIAGSTITTDANGHASIEISNGDYDYTVTAANHQDGSGSLTVDGSDTNESVTLTINKYMVTFNVVAEGGGVVEGVSIATDGETLTTDVNGQATIELPNGDYSYTTSIENYEDATGNYSVASEDVSVDVTITPVGIGSFGNQLAIYPVPANDKLFIEGNNVQSIVIMASDGRVMKNILSEGAKTVIDIKDLDSGTYFVKITTLAGVQTSKVVIR